jgi:hypothetical protein
MSHQADPMVVWALIGHAVTDVGFANALLANMDDVVQQSGFSLSPEQKTIVRNAVQFLLNAISPEAAFHQEQMHAQVKAQGKRTADMSEYTLQLFKDTLSNAANTYKTITGMNKVMFGTGIVLFVASGIVGVFSAGASAVLLGALGGATFVTLFLTGPLEKSQTALSNLVQVEAAFMNHFEQMTYWDVYGLAPVMGNPPMPDPARIEKASAELQQRTAETVALLQKYVEPAAPSRGAKGRWSGWRRTAEKER